VVPVLAQNRMTATAMSAARADLTDMLPRKRFGG